MIRRLLAVLLPLAVIGASGCASNSEQIVGGKPRTKTFSKVVSLSPSTTETWFATQKYEKLVGRTEACDWPFGIKSAPVVASVKPDYETLAKIKPDLVVYDKELYTDADIAKIKALGAETFEWDPKTVKDYSSRLIQWTEMIGGEINASTYLDKVYQEEEAARSRYESSPSGQAKTKLSAALVMPGSNGQHMWEGTEGFQADCLRVCSIEPVGPKGDRFVPLDAEALVKADPDFIILATKTPDDFVKDARFQALKAFKAGHVLGILPDVALRRGGRVELFIQGVSRIVYGAK